MEVMASEAETRGWAHSGRTRGDAEIQVQPTGHEAQALLLSFSQDVICYSTEVVGLPSVRQIHAQIRYLYGYELANCSWPSVRMSALTVESATAH